MPTYSISIRLQRTVVEEVHVSVPVTDDVMEERPDGSHGLNVDKIVAAAVRMGRETELAWRREGESEVTQHPIQTPPPGIGDDAE